MSGDGPTRTCVGCGARDAQRALMRVQLDEAGEPVVVGRARKGRSAYVHARAACAAALPKSRGISRSLRVTLGQAERARLRTSIEEQVVQALAHGRGE